MLVQPGFCRTCSKTKLLVFPRGGSFIIHVCTFSSLQCDKLEQIGFHSLMLITSSDKHFEIGSTKGMQFNLDNFDYVINFMEYCQGTDI